MPGKPHSPNPSQQKPYVVQQKSGQAFDKHGNLIQLEKSEVTCSQKSGAIQTRKIALLILLGSPPEKVTSEMMSSSLHMALRGMLILSKQSFFRMPNPFPGNIEV